VAACPNGLCIVCCAEHSTQYKTLYLKTQVRFIVRLRLKCDGTRAETRFRLSAKRTSPFISAGAPVHSTTGSRGVRISGSNGGYTCFEVVCRVLSTHSIRQFPLYFTSHASPFAITFQLDCTANSLHTAFLRVKCYQAVRIAEKV